MYSMYFMYSCLYTSVADSKGNSDGLIAQHIGNSFLCICVCVRACKLEREKEREREAVGKQKLKIKEEKEILSDYESEAGKSDNDAFFFHCVLVISTHLPFSPHNRLVMASNRNEASF